MVPFGNQGLAGQHPALMHQQQPSPAMFQQQQQQEQYAAQQPYGGGMPLPLPQQGDQKPLQAALGDPQQQQFLQQQQQQNAQHAQQQFFTQDGQLAAQQAQQQGQAGQLAPLPAYGFDGDQAFGLLGNAFPDLDPPVMHAVYDYDTLCLSCCILQRWCQCWLVAVSQLQMRSCRSGSQP
jgi:hypothetical protein